MQDVIQRTLDVSDAVRKQAFAVLAAKCGVADLSVDQRALLLRRGLRDRANTVVEAAREMLRVWLADACEGEVTRLLRMLDVRQFPGLLPPRSRDIF